MTKITQEEAIKTIKEWGVDCDNYVAHNYKQYLVGGEPYDTSQECADYFLECLKIVTGLDLKSNPQTPDRVKGEENEKI